MAGKSRKQGSRPSTPKGVAMELPKGHLGLKSSPFAPTDCKLTSQYMVVDHMSAHYRKINTAKSAIDTKAPKAWSVSQKVRDQARRAAQSAEAKRRDKWITKEMERTGRSSRASSDVARDEMLAMMEGLDEYDEVDFGKPAPDGNTTLEVHISDGYPDDKDMAFVNKMVTDNRNSPSKYHGTKVIASNIPSQNAARPNSGRLNTRPNSSRNRPTAFLNATQTLKQPSTPKSSDLLESQSYKFTEEKPFQPRINRTTAQSKLSTFKYYNAPKRTPRKDQDTYQTDGKVKGRPNQTRPVTPLTDSVDLMNASLMSRDLGTMKTPTGVPPLDISLDRDHLMWLKEQSRKAHLRSTYVTKENEINESHGQSDAHGFGQGTSRLEAGEEELKYLEFIQEVTNDVLDRGIFTNRVLKQVFNSHLQRRKHDLRVSRMRELLEELRQNLGIPSTDDDFDPGVGLTCTLNHTLDRANSPTRTLKFAESSTTKYIDDNMNNLSLDDGPGHKALGDMGPSGGLGGTLGGFDSMMMTTKKFDMTALRQASRAASQSRSRSPSPGTGRPPLPKARTRSRVSPSRENSLEADDSVFGKSYTSLDDLDDSRVISKQEEDFHAYKEPPPSTSSILGPGRNIEPIEELRETARTDATSVNEYQDDYEEETSRDPVSPAPKPTPRKRGKVGSKGSPSSTARTETETARSVIDTDMDTVRSGEGTVRSREGSARSRDGSVRSGGKSDGGSYRSRSGSPASKAGSYRSRSVTPTSRKGSPRSRSVTPKSGRNTPVKGTNKKNSQPDSDEEF